MQFRRHEAHGDLAVESNPTVSSGGVNIRSHPLQTFSGQLFRVETSSVLNSFCFTVIKALQVEKGDGNRREKTTSCSQQRHCPHPLRLLRPRGLEACSDHQHLLAVPRIAGRGLAELAGNGSYRAPSRLSGRCSPTAGHGSPIYRALKLAKPSRKHWGRRSRPAVLRKCSKFKLVFLAARATEGRHRRSRLTAKACCERVPA